MAKGDIYVANTSFVADIPDGGKDEDGNPTTQRHTALVGKRYGANHPLVKHAPLYFDAEDGNQRVNYGVESATAAPGEQRGAQ